MQQAQLIMPQAFVKFTNQVNTVPPESLTLRYDSSVKTEEAATAYTGMPEALHFLKTRGALPARAREYSERALMYKKEFPDDQAERRITALTMLGRTSIPAFAIATTNGLDPAPASPLSSDGESLGAV